VLIPIRSVASVAPTSSVSPPLAYSLLTNATVCHQAALARCAAECVLKQSDGDGTMFMTVTVYLSHYLISLCVRELRDYGYKSEVFFKTGVSSAVRLTLLSRRWVRWVYCVSHHVVLLHQNIA